MTPVLFVIVWDMEGIVDAGEDHQDVRKGGQDFVDPDTMNAMGFSSGERVDAVTA